MNQPEEGEEFIKKGRRLIGSAGGQARGRNQPSPRRSQIQPEGRGVDIIKKDCRRTSYDTINNERKPSRISGGQATKGLHPKLGLVGLHNQLTKEGWTNEL